MGCFREKLTEKWGELSVKIKTNFGLDMPMPEISFDLIGKVAGIAVLRENQIKLNKNGIEMFPEYILNQTFPHEVSHLLTSNLYRGRGYNVQPHGREWQRICITLGIPPNRCHNLALPTARETRKFQYICSNGHISFVGLCVHKKLYSQQQRRICRCGSKELKFIKEAVKKLEEVKVEAEVDEYFFPE